MHLANAQPSFDANGAKVLGIWKLVSQEIEVQETGRMESPMGEKPTGYAVFTRKGARFLFSPERCVSLQRTTRNVLGC
jgi:Lipocalin-like domain